MRSPPVMDGRANRPFAGRGRLRRKVYSEDEINLAADGGLKTNFSYPQAAGRGGLHADRRLIGWTVLLTIPPAVALRPFFGDSHSPKTLAEAAQRANVRHLVVHQRNGSRV